MAVLIPVKSFVSVPPIDGVSSVTVRLSKVVLKQPSTSTISTERALVKV